MELSNPIQATSIFYILELIAMISFRSNDTYEIIDLTNSEADDLTRLPFGGNDQTGLLWSNDIDACHGHTQPVFWDGQMIDLYHYHWTIDFLFIIGCYKGTAL